MDFDHRLSFRINVFMCIRRKQTVLMQNNIAKIYQQEIVQISYRLVQDLKITKFMVGYGDNRRKYREFRLGNALDHEGLCANQLWIGAVDINESGSFQWLDGQPFTYTNWDSSMNEREFKNNEICISRRTKHKLLSCIDDTIKWTMENRTMYRRKLFHLRSIYDINDQQSYTDDYNNNYNDRLL